jgi:ParB family chromosome partitioning protein
METRTQQIPIGDINIPDGQRELGDLDGLIGSIQMLGLLEPILVIHDGAHYRLIAGWRRYNACKRLGWPTIEANILEMDDLHAELATIDENIVRQELTALERSEQLSRRKEIYEALHPETKRREGPGRGHKEKKRKEFDSFVNDTASKTGRNPRTVQQDVQIDRKLSSGVKEKIRTLPIADKKSDLLLLARLPQETQEAIADQLVAGRADSSPCRAESTEGWGGGPGLGARHATESSGTDIGPAMARSRA